MRESSEFFETSRGITQKYILGRKIGSLLSVNALKVHSGQMDAHPEDEFEQDEYDQNGEGFVHNDLDEDPGYEEEDIE